MIPTLQAMVDEGRKVICEPVELRELDCHVNDTVLAEEVLAIIDRWQTGRSGRPPRAMTGGCVRV